MTASAPTHSNTCAIFVSYHPDQGFAGRVLRLLDQFPWAIVVDNGSQSAALSMLHDLALHSRVDLIANSSNQGIASALNQGVRAALQKRFEWVVTFDQDTEAAPVMLSTLIKVYSTSESANVVVGSNYRDAHRERNFISCSEAEPLFRERKTLITSGTLLPLSLFQEIGFFREDYFIDSVDHEYCLRARRHGYRIVISCQPLMTQRIGSGAENGRRQHLLMSFNHSATRKYFIARNTVVTAKSYLIYEPIWSMRQGWRLLMDLGSIFLFEKGKWRKTKAFLVGVLHGLIGKMGPIEKTWPNGGY